MISHKPKYPTFFKVTNFSFFISRELFFGVVKNIEMSMHGER